MRILCWRAAGCHGEAHTHTTCARLSKGPAGGRLDNRNKITCLPVVLSELRMEEEEEDSEEKEDSSRLPAVEVDGRGGACVGGGRELEEVKQLTWY
jgi:hypothetical protein